MDEGVAGCYFGGGAGYADYEGFVGGWGVGWIGVILGLGWKIGEVVGYCLDDLEVFF